MQTNRAESRNLHPIQKEEGQSAVEFALIAITLVLVIFFVVDLGRAMAIYSFLAGAAQAGARAGAATSDEAAIEAAAQARMTGFDSESVTIEIDQTGDYTEVSLTYTFEPVTPMISLVMNADSLTLSNTARIRRLSGGGGGGSAPTSTPMAATNTPAPPTNTPSGPTNTPAPPTSTPAPTETPVPTPTRCWPPGKCNK